MNARPNRFLPAVAWLSVLAAGLMPLGCVSEPAPTKKSTVRTTPSMIPDAPPAPKGNANANASIGIPATDDCAEQLHALCGSLLWYYKSHRALPQTLEQLMATAGPDPDISFNCPVSGKPYVFNAEGLPRKNHPGRIVLYDSEPSHNGVRYGISFDEPKTTGKPPVMLVVAEPEAFFHTEPEPVAPPVKP